MSHGPLRDMPLGIYAGILLTGLLELAWVVLAATAPFQDPEMANAVRLRIGHLHFAAADPFALLVIGALSVVTWAFATGRSWARPAAVTLWALAPASLLPPATREGMATLMQAIAVVLLVAWYLYRHEPVVAYYERLGVRRLGSGCERPPVE